MKQAYLFVVGESTKRLEYVGRDGRFHERFRRVTCRYDTRQKFYRVMEYNLLTCSVMSIIDQFLKILKDYRSFLLKKDFLDL